MKGFPLQALWFLCAIAFAFSWITEDVAIGTYVAPLVTGALLAIVTWIHVRHDFYEMLQAAAVAACTCAVFAGLLLYFGLGGNGLKVGVCVTGGAFLLTMVGIIWLPRRRSEWPDQLATTFFEEADIVEVHGVQWAVATEGTDPSANISFVGVYVQNCTDALREVHVSFEERPPPRRAASVGAKAVDAVASLVLGGAQAPSTILALPGAVKATLNAGEVAVCLVAIRWVLNAPEAVVNVEALANGPSGRRVRKQRRTNYIRRPTGAEQSAAIVLGMSPSDGGYDVLLSPPWLSAAEPPELSLGWTTLWQP